MVVAVVLAAASMPPTATGHSSRMSAIRRLPPDVQADRAAQLERVVTGEKAVGTYWDEAADQIVVVVPADGTSPFNASDVDQLGLDVRVESRSISQEDIGAIEQTLSARAWSESATRVNFFSYLDAKKGKYVIATDGDPDDLSYFLARFPGEIEIVREPVQSEARRDDTAPHWGGAQLNINGQLQCSSGFSVTKNGVGYMTTAKHCYSLNQGVVGGTGVGWGVVKYAPSGIDVELIGNSTYSGSIYVGGATGTGHPVRGASDPVSWNKYCVSGLSTYEHCGHTYAGRSGPLTIQGEVVTDMAMFTGGTQTIGGDSGAPWYFYDSAGNIYIAGIHSGHCGTAMCATPWSKISSWLGVSIVTG